MVGRRRVDTARQHRGRRRGLEYTATASDGARCPRCPAPRRGATSCVIAGLANATPYTFTVTATNPSAPAHVSTASAPGQPTVVHAPPDHCPRRRRRDRRRRATPAPSSPGPRADRTDGWTRRVDVLHGHRSTARPQPASDGRRHLVRRQRPAERDAVHVHGHREQRDATPSPAPVAPTRRRHHALTSPGPCARSQPPPRRRGRALGSGAGYVELTNTSGTDARLGGYGFWDADVLATTTTDGSIEDRAAYLFAAGPDARRRQDATGLLRAAPATLPHPRPIRLTFDRQPVHRAAPTADFVELANLNGAQIACTASHAGRHCRAAQALSVSSSPVGVTARDDPVQRHRELGRPDLAGGTPITGYTATAFDAPVGGNAIASCTAGGGDRSCSFPASIGAKYYVEVVAAMPRAPRARRGASWLLRGPCPARLGQRGRLRDARVGST